MRVAQLAEPIFPEALRFISLRRSVDLIIGRMTLKFSLLEIFGNSQIPPKPEVCDMGVKFPVAKWTEQAL